jgi:hypothetical protein
MKFTSIGQPGFDVPQDRLTGTNTNDFNGPHQTTNLGQEFESLRAPHYFNCLWGAIADRFAACKLVLHPEKTRIVYCKDANRRGDFPNQSFDFLGFSFRARKTMWQGLPAQGFMPAVSPKALKAISRKIRRWTLQQRSDKSLQDLANMYNPYIRGWINYYGNFYRTQLRSTLTRIDLYVIRWACRKFKRFRHNTEGARDWLERLRRTNPTLLVHWQLWHSNGRTSGAV